MAGFSVCSSPELLLSTRREAGRSRSSGIESKNERTGRQARRARWDLELMQVAGAGAGPGRIQGGGKINSFRLQRSSPNEKENNEIYHGRSRGMGVVMLNGFSGIRRYGGLGKREREREGLCGCWLNFFAFGEIWLAGPVWLPSCSCCSRCRSRDMVGHARVAAWSVRWFCAKKS